MLATCPHCGMRTVLGDSKREEPRYSRRDVQRAVELAVHKHMMTVRRTREHDGGLLVAADVRVHSTHRVSAETMAHVQGSWIGDFVESRVSAQVVRLVTDAVLAHLVAEREENRYFGGWPPHEDTLLG